MTLIEIFAIIIIHFIADFILQDEKWALGKSKYWSDLVSHTFTYTFVFFVFYIIFALTSSINYGLKADYYGHTICVMWYFPITFIAHTVTDYFTSRIVSKSLQKVSMVVLYPTLVLLL